MQPNWIKYKTGGILKAQSGIKSPYQLIMQENPSTYTDGYGVEREEYEPKWIKVGRNIRQRLSPALNANGGRKYVGSSGMLGFLVAPEWEGLEIPEVTAMHYGMKGKPVMQAIETERLTNIPQKVVKAKPVAKPKDPYSPAMKAAFKEKTGYDFDGIPEIMKQRELKSWQDYVARLRQGHKRQ